MPQERDAAAKIRELAEKVEALQTQLAAAEERSHVLDANAKDETERLQAEIAAERKGRTADASREAAHAQQLQAALEELQGALASQAEASSRKESEVSAKIRELTQKIETLQAQLAAAIERGDALGARKSEEVEGLTSEILQLLISPGTILF